MSERTRSTARGPPVEEPISRHCGLTEPGLGVPGNVEGVEAEGTGARILAGRTSLLAQGAQLLHEIAAEIIRRSGGARTLRLRQIIDRSEREALQRDLGISLRERRDHDDLARGMRLQDQRQRRKAVDLGHLDVEQDDVRLRALRRIDGHPAVGRRRGDLEAARFGEPSADHAANDGTVVDDHDPRRATLRGNWNGAREQWTCDHTECEAGSTPSS